MPKDLGRVDWKPRLKKWRVILYKGKADKNFGDYNTKSKAESVLRDLIRQLKRYGKNFSW